MRPKDLLQAGKILRFAQDDMSPLSSSVRITYAEHAPGVGLADAVRCYWTIRGEPDASDPERINRILPDNCIDVIFDLQAGTGFLVSEERARHALFGCPPER